MLKTEPTRSLRRMDVQIALLYMVFASLWIFGTDYLAHSFMLSHSIYLWVAALRRVGLIIISGLLLYLLLRTFRGEDREAVAAKQDYGLRSLFIAFLALALVVPVVGFSVVRLNGPQIRRAAFADLNAIAKLKTQQIEDTLAGWRGDAEMLAATTGFIADLDAWVQRRDPKAGARYRSRLASMERVYHFEVSAYDAAGRLVYGKNLDGPSTALLQPFIDEAVRTRKVQATDLHRNGGGRLRLDYVAPLILSEEGGTRLAAMAILRAPVEEVLFPMVRHWPIPSGTAEMILARREGNEVVFLNELRHRQGTALALRFSVDSMDLPAAKAVRDAPLEPVEMEGKDYRNVKVMAVLQPVKGTHWFSIGKIDLGEAMAAHTKLAGWTSVVALTAVFVLMVALVLLWRQQQRTQALAILAQTAESERGFKALFENMAEGFTHCQILFEGGVPSDFIFLKTNTHFERMVGAGALAGRKVSEVHPGFQDANSDVLEMYGRISTTGLPESGEVYIKPLGRWHSLSAYCPAEGQIVALIEDVTERKQSELRIRKLNRTLKVLSNVNQAIVRHRDLHVLYDDVCQIAVEDGGFRLAWVGLQDGSTLGMKILAPSGDYGNYFEEAQITLSEGICEVCPILAAMQSGEPHWCQDLVCAGERFFCCRAAGALGFRSSIALPLKVAGVVRGTLNLYASEPNFFDDEERLLLFELATDISYAMEFLEQQVERRRAEETLGQVNRRLEATLNAMPDVLFEVDQNGLILSHRAASANMTKRAFDQPVGRHLEDVFPPEAAGILISAIREAQEKGIHFGASFSLGTASAVDWYELSISRVGPLESSDCRFLVLARDITARKRAEEANRDLEHQLRQSQKLESLGTLASGIAHDFNNILGIIMGNATLMEDHPLDAQALQRRTEAIQTASKRGSELVRQMLAFARQADAHFESVPLEKVVREVATLISETFPKTVAIKVEVDEGLPNVQADISQINQVLLNLCVNARDAMPSGGTLTLSLGRPGSDWIKGRFHHSAVPEYLRLSVSDTGCGMDEATLTRIFEPFYTTKEWGKGTGLGLSMVFGIMESHGGFIDVESQAGKGSAFHCCFPVVEGPDEPRQVEPTVAHSARGDETILLVDDEIMLLETLRHIFERKGYRVLVAGDGEEALNVYRDHPGGIQLVFSDFGLPKFDGYELYLRLKALDPNVRVIIASGFVEPLVKERMIRDGILSVIQKPCRSEDLHRALRAALDR